MLHHNCRFLLIILTVVVASCGKSSDTDVSTQQDMRIVCVSKQLNEIIFALGAEEHLVGADLTSIYPPEINKLPKVGYHRLLNVEGIISLNPTVVFHDGNVAPEAAIDQVRKVGIAVREFPEAHTLDETKELIRTLGSVFSRETRADSLCNKLDADMKQVNDSLKHYTDHPRVVLIHFGQQSNIYLTVGQKSTATTMIEWAGGTNSISVLEGMKPISPEVIATAQPDVILATDVGFDKAGGMESFKNLPGVGLTPAARNNKIYRLEEHDVMYLGPQTGENVLHLMKLIHGK